MRFSSYLRSLKCHSFDLEDFNCHSIVTRFGLKCLNGFLLHMCDDRKSSLYFLSVVLVCLKSLNCMVRVEWIEVSFGSCHEFCFSYGFRPDTDARNDRRAVCLVRVRQGFQDVKWFCHRCVCHFECAHRRRRFWISRDVRVGWSNVGISTASPWDQVHEDKSWTP